MSDRMLSPLIQILERYPLFKILCAVRFSQLHLFRGVHLYLIFVLVAHPSFLLHLAHLQLNAWSNLILLHLDLPFIHIMHLPGLETRLAPLTTPLMRPRSRQPPAGALAFLGGVTCSQCTSANFSVTLLKTFGVLWVQSVFEGVAYESRFVIVGWVSAV